ncbi:hypothetical protein SBRCBS47491_007810 [Sporothrix bragantina]|uniref:DUF7892 domain-containing protein n=1 Tax=Sporothrix bragantina TaxID=671064 RepID=A0ABP0CG86_9PEZI
MDLVLSAASTFLIPALQFVFVTSDTCVVPLSVIERGLLPPASTLTKLFWTADVEKLREEFSSVRELGASAAEEWQKGLTTRGSDQRTDIAKWEKYSDSGGVANMRSLLYPGYKPQNVISVGVPTGDKTKMTNTIGEATSKPFDDNLLDLAVTRMTTKKISTELVTTPALPFSSKEKTREEIDAEWDEIQGPVRLKILKFADEAINGDWDEGDKVTKINAPAFAADVLLHVRKRFYMEVEKDAKEARAAGREPVVDPFGGPFTQKLSLENMKYVFDVKVKPITVGNVVVHWRAEWPEEPPFRANPRVSKSTGQPLPLQQPLPPRPPNHRSFPPPPPYHGQSGFQKYSNPWTPARQLPPPPPPPLAPQPEFYPPYQQTQAHQPLATGNNGHDVSYSGIPYSAGPPRLLPTGVDNYAEPMQTTFQPPPQLHPQPTYQPYVEGTVERMMSSSVGVHTQEVAAATAPSRPPTSATPDVQVQRRSENALSAAGYAPLAGRDDFNTAPGVFYSAKYEETLREIKHLWTSIHQLRGVPGVVKLHTLLHHANKFFESKFGEQLPLTLFSEGVSDRKELSSIRNVNELPCKACHLKLGCIPGYKEDRSLFTLPQLLYHFSRAHVGSRGDKYEPSTGPLDWLQDMLILPQPSALSDLVNKSKDHGRASHLLSETVGDLRNRDDGGKQPSFDMTAARKKALLDRRKTASPREAGQRSTQPGLKRKNGGPNASASHQSSDVDKNRGKENGKQQHAPVSVASKRGDGQDESKVPTRLVSRPAVGIKHEPVECAQAPAPDIPMHDTADPAEEGQHDLLGALESHLRGAPAQEVGHRPMLREEFVPARGQSRVVYVDERGRELVPQREARGSAYVDECHVLYTSNAPADTQGRHGPVSRVPHGQYRERSPLPVRHYADELGYAARNRDYEDFYERGPVQAPPAYQYQRHRPPPRQEYYEEYIDGSGRRFSYPRSVEYDRYEAYEVVHVVDPEGDYYARRPVRREYPQAGPRESERHYSPAPAVGGRPAPLRREYGDLYHEPGYGGPYDPYAHGARPERGSGYARTGGTRAVVAPPVADRGMVQNDTAYYEEYDPHHPAEDARLAGEPGTAPAQDGRQQVRYQ